MTFGAVFNLPPGRKKDGVKMKILFEDGSVVVCVKPVGMLSQGEGSDCLITALKELTNGEIYPIHRLDRGVGGVMVFAKTKAAAAALSRQVAERKLQKEYFALIHGAPEKESGVLQDLLFKDSKKNKVFVVNRERKGVKKAVCEYETLLKNTDCAEPYSLVNVKLQTGRTHQIRVQFSSRGCPIFGDRRYGARDNEKNIALFSHRIGFFHPETGKELAFSFDGTECEILNNAVEAAKNSEKL